MMIITRVHFCLYQYEETSDIKNHKIGPWTLQVGADSMPFTALTIIDLVTNWINFVRLENKTAAHTALKFKNTWLVLSMAKPHHI